MFTGDYRSSPGELEGFAAAALRAFLAGYGPISGSAPGFVHATVQAPWVTRRLDSGALGSARVRADGNAGRACGSLSAALFLPMMEARVQYCRTQATGLHTIRVDAELVLATAGKRFDEQLVGKGNPVPVFLPRSVEVGNLKNRWVKMWLI